jgi:hypothetical protein
MASLRGWRNKFGKLYGSDSIETERKEKTLARSHALYGNVWFFNMRHLTRSIIENRRESKVRDHVTRNTQNLAAPEGFFFLRHSMSTLVYGRSVYWQNGDNKENNNNIVYHSRAAADMSGRNSSEKKKIR